jgi:hypothetical protein
MPARPRHCKERLTVVSNIEEHATATSRVAGRPWMVPSQETGPDHARCRPLEGGERGVCVIGVAVHLVASCTLAPVRLTSVSERVCCFHPQCG